MNMKKFYSLLMISMALFAVACGDDDEKGGGDAPALLADNTLVYDGVTYKGRCGVMISNNVVQYSLTGEGIQLSGNIGSAENTSTTIDLTKHYEEVVFTTHINLGNQQGDVLDLKYQNYPQNYWCFLNGDNFNGTSCFKSGTATVTMNDGSLTLVIDGTLVNGKPLKYKIVYNHEGTPDPKVNEIKVGDKTYTVEAATIKYDRNANLSYEYYLFGQGETAPFVKVEVAPESLGSTVLLKEKKSAVRYRITISFHDNPQITACQDAFFEDVQSSYFNVTTQETDKSITGCIFTTGTLSTKKDDKTISMNFSGTLDNGSVVSAQASFNVSEIVNI